MNKKIPLNPFYETTNEISAATLTAEDADPEIIIRGVIFFEIRLYSSLYQRKKPLGRVLDSQPYSDDNTDI
jgi:hypothetical protein